MEFFSLMIAGVAIVLSMASPIGLLILWSTNQELRRRVDELEAQQFAFAEHLKQRPLTPQPTAPKAQPEVKPQEAPAQSAPSPAPAPATPAEPQPAPAQAAEGESAAETPPLEQPQPAAEAQQASNDPEATSIPEEAAQQPQPDTTTTPETAPESPQESAADSSPAPIPTPDLKETKTPRPSTPAPPPKVSKPMGLEQLLGANLAIWGGGGALGLAAILLVQYGIENDLIGPELRIGMGAVVCLAMIVIGELAFKRIRAVGGGLVGAGIVGLYATFGAATALYGLISPWLAGGLMVLTTITAAALSIRHKLLIIAIIGLLGGFVTPALLGVSSDSPVGFLIYLMVLHTGVIAVVAKRRWPVLLTLSAMLTFVAELAWLLRGPEETTPSFIILSLLLTLPVMGASLWGAGFYVPDKDKEDDGPTTAWGRIEASSASPWAIANLHICMVATMVVMTVAACWWTFPALSWWAQVPLGGGALVLVALLPRLGVSLPALAYGVMFMHQVLFLGLVEPEVDNAMHVFAQVGALYVLGLAFISVLRPTERAAAVFGVAAATVQFLMAFSFSHAYNNDQPGLNQTWAVVAVLMAIFFVGVSLAAQWRNKRLGHEGNAAVLAVTSVAAQGFLALSPLLAFDGMAARLGWMAVAVLGIWAGAAFKEMALAAVAALMVWLLGAALLLPTGNTDGLEGGLPILNGVLLLYGSAVGCALWSAWHLERSPQWGRASVLSLRLLSLGLFLALVTLEIRHFYHPDFSGDFTRSEQLTYSLGWAAVGFGALLFGLWRRNAVSRWVSLALILGTTMKVFLFDLSYLDGLWRVGSLAALGVVLIAIATLYRLYVFPSESEQEASTPEVESEDEPEETS